MTLKKRMSVVALGLSAILALSSCGTTDDTGGAPSGSATTTTAAAIKIGTTDKATTLDPAGAYDHGSFTIEIQIYQFLYTFAQGSKVPNPDAAESCEFTAATTFTCKLKSGLKFANGHALTSSDVKFSFDRIIAIDDPQGPASLLSNLDSVVVVDDLTVNFLLKEANDQTFLQVLATNAGPIVDEEVLDPKALTPDKTIVDANAFSGPYSIKSYSFNELIEFVPYADYNGAHGKVANAGVTMQVFTDATNLKLSIENGEIDVAYRSLTPTDIETLQANSNVKVWQAAGGEIRYIVWNFNTQPGDTWEQKLAIRQAVATLVDRDALATNVYKGQYIPLYSFVPKDYPGATTAVGDAYGTKPDPAKATSILAAAGVTTPVVLNLQYNGDHYGSSSDQEYGLIKSQLEASGLFTVNLQQTEWTTYSKERRADAYPVYQLGWFPDFPDADNYLNPFFNSNNFLGNHFNDVSGLVADDVTALLVSEATETDPATRLATLAALQKLLAEKYLPTIPLLNGSQWAVTGTSIDGIYLSPSDNLPFAGITRK